MVWAWLLSASVLEDLLDNLIYCHRPNNLSREPTPVLRGHNYLVPGALTNWANEGIVQDQLRGGLFDPEARGPEPRANPGPANEASELQEGDDRNALLVALSGASLDVSGVAHRREGSVARSSPTGGERRESPAETYTTRSQIVEPVEYTRLGRTGTASCSRRHDTEGERFV